MSRVLMAFAVLCWVSNISNAELNLTGGNELIGAQGGDNEFGNLDGDYATFNQMTINGFPSAGMASPSTAAASASLDFLYTQVGDVANLTQTITQQQDGVDFGLAEHRFTIEFTALNNLKFNFTAEYNGLSTVGDPRYHVALFDQTTLSNVFSDNSEDPSDLIPVENHTGYLIAGHKYSLNGGSQLYAGNVGSGVAASATGKYVFTTSAVPEPSSMLLMSVGAVWFARRRYLRR